TIVAGALAVGAGAFASPDAVTAAIATIAIIAVIALELVHVGRRLDVAAAPNDLEIAGTLFAFLTTVIVAVLAAAPIVAAVADPVPVAALAFRTLERSATAVSTVFALFEERAGVWLALVLIVGVVVWAVR